MLWLKKYSAQLWNNIFVSLFFKIYVFSRNEWAGARREGKEVLSDGLTHNESNIIKPRHLTVWATYVFMYEETF